MTRDPNHKTLFHLVPANDLAEDALRHPDNLRFVSLSGENTPGLEVGFHIPPFSRGHVITRLGRNTDLVLRQSFSAVHVAFEIHPETLVVRLSVRTKRASSVTVAPLTKIAGEGQAISGDCAIIYGQDYAVTIASYHFKLIWREIDGRDTTAESLKELTNAGYQESLLLLKNVRSRDLSIPETSTPNSWYMTRLQSSKAAVVAEVKGSRTLVGQGAFGKVFRAVDQTSGNYFAVKVVNLRDQGLKVELARAALHKEIKILERASHPNIIECLGTSDFHTDNPLIFMPLRPGSLDSLVTAKGASGLLCNQVLAQMLSALDYLAFRKLCHRDLKPPNILYQPLEQERYDFQLADFGFANDFRLATTFCGTGYYLAPELFGKEPQTPKMDVWSLFATMAEIHPGLNYPPKGGNSYGELQHALQIAAASPLAVGIRPMARIDPTRRASAAQMLVKLFQGEGLTTPRADIPDIEPDRPERAITVPLADLAPVPAPPRVVEYPRRRQQAQHARPAPRPTRRPGILPNRILPNRLPGQQPVIQPLLRVQRDGIAKRPAAQVKPEQRRAQQGQPQQRQPPPAYEKRPPPKREREPVQNPLIVVPVVSVQQSMVTPRLPGAFPA